MTDDQEVMQRAEATHPAPSTFDFHFGLPAIAGGQDPLLATIIEARHRYLAGATMVNYLDTARGTVCAAGAIMSLDEGLERWGRSRYQDHYDETLPPMRAVELCIDHSWVTTYEQYEMYATQVTKDAIRYLNETAEQYFRDDVSTAWDAASEHRPRWRFGAIEAVNQELPWDVYESYTDPSTGETSNMPKAKVVVLSVYDKAVDLLSHAQVEA